MTGGRTRKPVIEKRMRKITVPVRIFLTGSPEMTFCSLCIRITRCYFPNTVFSRSVTLAAGSVLIFFSSWPIT